VITSREEPPARGCPGAEGEGLSTGRAARRFAREAGGGREFPARDCHRSGRGGKSVPAIR
jgi:hypothetical protein